MAQKVEWHVTIQKKLEGQSDESELEVSDSSDTESDHLSEPSHQVILSKLPQ